MTRIPSVPRILVPVVLLLALAGLTGCTEPPSEPVPDGTPTVAAEASPDPTSAESSDDSGEAEPVAGDGSGTGQTTGTGQAGTGQTSGSGQGATAPAVTPSAAPPPAAPAAAKPTVTITAQQCASGKLKVTLRASLDGSYRKGIASVTLERQNEYDAWLSASATWLGPETGAGDQWTGNPPGHKNQRFQDQLRVTAVASNGERTVVTVTITANC